MRDSYFLFSVAGRVYAVPSAEVREVVHIAALSRMPGHPPILEGFLNLRGRTVPVVSLRALFGDVAGEPDLYAPLIVLRTEPPLALLADDALELREVGAEDLLPVDRNASVNDCAAAEFRMEAGVVTVLSTDRLLLVQEQERIATLQAQLEARLADVQGGVR